MNHNVTLSEKCEDLLEDNYEALRDPAKPTSAVEDEMRRHYLTAAKKQGWVRSFFKKQPMTLVA